MKTQDKSMPVLIIVHPGSAYGSAEFSLGRPNADIQRLEMQELVSGWEGGVLVIDGALSEDLDRWKGSWREWGQTITDALARAQSLGLPSARIMGCDSDEYNQEADAVDLVRQHGLAPQTASITLTGAWIDAEGGGCVHSVREALEALGFTPGIE